MHYKLMKAINFFNTISSNTNEFLRECQGAALLEADSNSRGRSRLNDRERRQAALPILVFGNDLVNRFFLHSTNSTIIFCS